MSTELHTFTREELIALAKYAAKLNIVGDFFVGMIGTQEATELPDGSIEVRTQVTRAPHWPQTSPRRPLRRR